MELYDKFWMLIPVEYHNNWFYFATPPLMETCEKISQSKKAIDTRTQGTVEQLLGEVELIL